MDVFFSGKCRANLNAWSYISSGDTIIRDETTGVQAGRFVTLPLKHRQPHQGLNSREIDTARLKGILIVQQHLPTAYLGPLAMA
jgi:hypothetical protein